MNMSYEVQGHRLICIVAGAFVFQRAFDPLSADFGRGVSPLTVFMVAFLLKRMLVIKM